MNPTCRTISVVLALAICALTASAVDKQTTLYTFQGVHTHQADGAVPESGLVADTAGNLYGTTYNGGGCPAPFTQGCGIVFKLAPQSNGSYTKTTLYTFQNQSDGGFPTGNLIFDAAGNLYGTTEYGGILGGNCTYGCGTVYELSPNSSGGWTETVLYSFPGGTGPKYSLGSLTFDAAGNLYGTTFTGGSDSSAGGTIYELSPSSGGWTETTLHNFALATGIYPYAGVIFDAAGNLYGTASQGVSNAGQCSGYACGAVYRLAKTASGWQYGLLYTFEGPRGLQPHDALVMDQSGNLYGTTFYGGTTSNGVIFELSPTTVGQWKETLIHSFTGGADGIVPKALSIDSAGNIYGTSSAAAFKLIPSSSGGWQFQILCALANGDTYNSPLLRNSAGALFGMSYGGGSQQAGTVYELTPVVP